MSDSSDSDFADGFVKSTAIHYQRRNIVNADDPRSLPGPSGIDPRRYSQNENVITENKKIKSTARISVAAGSRILKQKAPSKNIRPEDYQLPEPLIQEESLETFYPQNCDEVVYFQQDNQTYFSVARKNYDADVSVDVKLMPSSSANFYTSHDFSILLVRLRTDLLARIIRDSLRDIPIREFYFQRFHELNDNWVEIIQIEEIYELEGNTNDDNRLPIVQEVANNEIPQDSVKVQQRLPICPYQPRVSNEVVILEILAKQRKGKLNILLKEHGQTIIRPAMVPQPNGVGTNQLSVSPSHQHGSHTGSLITPLKVNEVKNKATSRSQGNANGTAPPVAVHKLNATGSSVIVLKSNEDVKNHYAPSPTKSVLKSSENIIKNQPTTSQSQQNANGTDPPLAVLKSNEYVKNQLATIRFQTHNSSSSNQPVKSRKVNENGENQLSTIASRMNARLVHGINRRRVRHSTSQEDENVENQPSSRCTRKCGRRNSEERAFQRANANDESQPPIICQKYGINVARKQNILDDFPLRPFISPVIIDYKRRRTTVRDVRAILQKIGVCRDPPQVRPGEGGPGINQNQQPNVRQERVHTPGIQILQIPLLRSKCQRCLFGPGIDRNQPLSNKFQKRVTAPSDRRIYQNQPPTNTYQERGAVPSGLRVYRNQPSTGNGQERGVVPIDLQISLCTPTTSQARPSNGFQAHRRHQTCRKKKLLSKQQRAVMYNRKRKNESVNSTAPTRKFAIKRPQGTSSDSTTTSTSDSDAPTSSKGKPKQARLQKISKKTWRADCFRVLRNLWQDEYAEMFREAAMENYRRLVPEWITLEYIMHGLRSGAYANPDKVIEEVHTMLLHGRSLISTDEKIAIKIDDLSLFFDALICSIIQMWLNANPEGEENLEEESHSDLPVDDISTSPTIMPKSTSPESPS